MLQQEFFGIFATLPDAFPFIGIPSATLVDDIFLWSHIDDFADLRNAFAVHDVHLSSSEWRRNFIFDYLDFCAVTHDLCSALDLFRSSDFQSDSSIKFKRSTPGSRFRITEHDTDFLADLIDEDGNRFCFVDRSGQFP